MPAGKHPISGEPIIFAPGRAGRPNAFGREDRIACPFCPGHESETPPEIARTGDPWRVRAFPNKYPAVEGHEVIVESNRHDASFETIDHAADAVAMYVARYDAHSSARCVSLFKNAGERAGASIDHIHSQLMPLSFVPPRIERQMDAFRKRHCPLCTPPENLIDENEAFVRLAPIGSQYAYEQWIVPKRHQSAFTTLDDNEVVALAAMLQESIRVARGIAGSHNVLFMNFPRHSGAHFYIDVVPRLTSVAGFELATGTFIDIIEPAAAARRLK